MIYADEPDNFYDFTPEDYYHIIADKLGGKAPQIIKPCWLNSFISETFDLNFLDLFKCKRLVFMNEIMIMIFILQIITRIMMMISFLNHSFFVLDISCLESKNDSIMLHFLLLFLIYWWHKQPNLKFSRPEKCGKQMQQLVKQE